MLAEPALLSWISGKLGNQVYLNVHGKLCIREKGVCVQANTGSQAVRQANLVTISQAWSLVLTEDERQSWIRKASAVVFTSRSGKRVHHSGYHLFISRALNLSLIGIPLPTLAPDDADQFQIRTLSIDTVAPNDITMQCLLTNATLDGGFPRLLLEITDNLLPGVTYFSNLYRFIDTSSVGNPFGNAGFQAFALWHAVYPHNLISGDRLACRACIISDISGQRTPWRKATIITP